jgi:hypothetical protein
MPAPLTLFSLQPSTPGTRFWVSFNATNYNWYVFVLEQVRDAEGNWSGYVVGYSTARLYWQTVVYGSRPHAPESVPGNPFSSWDDMLAACQAVLDTLS